MKEHISVERVIRALLNCRREKNLVNARQLYVQLCHFGLDSNKFVGNYIVPMFVDCSSLLDAQHVFYKLKDQNDHSWASIISGYIGCGQSKYALHIWEKMRLLSVQPDKRGFTFLLKACGMLKDLERGQDIHCEILKKGLDTDEPIDTPLYPEVCPLSQVEVYEEYLGFQSIVDESDEEVAHFSTLNRAFHTYKANNRVQTQRNKAMAKSRRLGNSLVAMYIKCGAISDAQQVFESLPLHDVVSWNVLLAGYAEHGYIEIALKCFEQMHLQGILPDAKSWTTIIAGYTEYGNDQEVLKLYEEMQAHGITPDAIVYDYVLKACGNIGAIDKGRELHGNIKQKKLDTDVFIVSVLIDMYAKGGFLLEAREAFDNLPVRDVATWNSMLKGYSLNHESDHVIECFQVMIHNGVDPNSITFTCILAACSHSKLVEEGQRYFQLMIELYGIVPTIDHFTCIIDLYARLGGLCEADKFLQTVPNNLHDVNMWASFMSACKTYGDLELGMRCFKRMIKINPHNSAYVSM